MDRADHALRSVSQDRYPAAMACLAVDGRWVATESRPAHETEELVGWAAVAWRASKGIPGDSIAVCGCTAESFWEALARRLVRDTALTVVVERAERTLTLLGLWPLLESGAWTLAGREAHQDAATGKQTGGGQQSHCTLSSACFVVHCRPRGKSGSVTFVGADNYGFPPFQHGEGADRRVNGLALAVRDMIALLRREHLGSLMNTVASQSLHTFKRRFITNWMRCHDHGPALDLEAASYYGGWCEAHRLGRMPGTVYHLDQCAAYPAVCRDESVPTQLVGYARDVPARDCIDLMDEYTCFAEVTLATETPDYPYRDPRRGKVTIYPVGRFRTALAHPELVRAVRAGHIVDWHAICWHTHAHALALWATHLLRLRSDMVEDCRLRSWIKLLMNCLIGKFGQRDRRWVDSPTGRPHRAWDQWWEWSESRSHQRWRSLAGWTQYEEVGGFSHDAIPAIAAFVTSAQRMRLLDAINEAGRWQVYYHDTDSIMTSEDGYSAMVKAGMVRPGVPGAFEIREIGEDVHIYGIKTYSFAGRTVAAGVAVEPGWTDVAEGKVYRVAGAASAARAGHAPQAGRSSENLNLIDRYRHGRVTLDGTVFPLRVEE